MKKAYFLLLIGFITLPINSQSYDDASEALELCSFVQGSVGNNFMNDKEADIALDKILSVIGASKRFILQPCSEINNAVATSYKGIRYILYDKSFMNAIANQSNSWSQLFILAHEVGHHINGHSIDILLAAADVVEPRTLSSKRQQELESDEFAGFVLGKLGATLEQSSEAIKSMSSDGDDTYSTHPNKVKRLNAIKIGYDKALGKERVVFEEKTSSIKAEEYFNSGNVLSKKGDHYGAIAYYIKAIELRPDYFEAYQNSGVEKTILKDYYGAIADFNKAIELKPDDDINYVNRGMVRKKLEDFYGALNDFTKAITLLPWHPTAYYHRGNTNYLLEDYKSAIADYTEAIEQRSDFAMAYYGRGLVKYKMGDSYGAVPDFRKAIHLGPVKPEYYYNNGLANLNLGELIIARYHFSKAIQLNPNDSRYYESRGLTKARLKDYYGAISDFTKAIGLDSNRALFYHYRSLAKYALEDCRGAREDARKARQLGYDATTELTTVLCK